MFTSEIIVINADTPRDEESLREYLAKLLSTSPKEYNNPNDRTKWRPEMAAEEDAFKKGLEKEVPDEVIKYCQWVIDNGLEIKLYRKYITNSCKEAVKARNEVLAGELIKPLEDENEPKTIVFNLFEDNHEYVEGSNAKHQPPKYILKENLALVIEADDAILENDQHKLDKQKILEFVNKKWSTNYTKIELDNERTHGRQEPVVYYLSNPEGKIIFDKSFLLEKTRCNNAGRGTWGFIAEDFVAFVIKLEEKMGDKLAIVSHVIESEKGICGIVELPFTLNLMRSMRSSNKSAKTQIVG